MFSLFQNISQPTTVDECIVELKLLSARQSTTTNKLSQLLNVRSDQHEDFNNVPFEISSTLDTALSSPDCHRSCSPGRNIEKVADGDEVDNEFNDTSSRCTGVTEDRVEKFWRLDSEAKMKSMAKDLSKDLAAIGDVDDDEEATPLVVALRKLQDTNIKKIGIKMWTDCLADLFNKTDVDGSGAIQLAEYKEMIEKLDVSLPMKKTLWDKFDDIDMDKDGIISLYEFLFFFLKFQKFNEELLLNYQNNTPYWHEKDLLIWQRLRLSIYTFIECPNRNLASKALFCLDLMITSVPVVMLFWQAINPSHKIDWGQDTYLWGISIFFAIQWLLGFFTCRNTRIFILDLTHTTDLLSFVFWIAYNTVLQPGLMDPMGFVAFRIFRLTKIHNVFSLAALEENLAIYTNTLQLAYTAYGVVLGFLSMLILFWSILFYAFERGHFSEEEGVWIRDRDEGESPFSNLFNCIYFTIATFTTLGNGPVTPKSYVGRIVAVTAVISGLGNLTFLISIIGSCFQEVFRVYVKTRSENMEEARTAYIERQILRASDNVKERLSRKKSRRSLGETELMLDRS